MDNWAQYFYTDTIPREEAEKREDMYQAFKDRLRAEGLFDNDGVEQ
jgi:hypothetical protein